MQLIHNNFYLFININLPSLEYIETFYLPGNKVHLLLPPKNRLNNTVFTRV